MDEGTDPGMGCRFEIYRDFAGRFRWRLRDDDLEIAADSARSFRSYQDASRAAERAKQLARDADVAGNRAEEENVL